MSNALLLLQYRYANLLKLATFGIFCLFSQHEEHYLCIHTQIDGDMILFSVDGGVDVGDVDSKVNECKGYLIHFTPSVALLREHRLYLVLEFIGLISSYWSL